MVIAFPVAGSTESLVETFVSLVETQGGLSEHHVLVIHDREGFDLAAKYAARLAPLTKSASPMLAAVPTPVPESSAVASLISHIRQTADRPLQVMWLEPGVLPKNAFAFDLVAAAISQYPNAALFTGRSDGPEPTEIVVFNSLHFGKNAGIRKLVLSKDRSWRSLMTFVNTATLFLPVLSVGSGASLFDKFVPEPPVKRAKPLPAPAKTDAKVEQAVVETVSFGD